MISQDVILFMGQSNMAGRGEAKKATVCDGKAGVEFRAISNPSSFVPLLEPFGKNENVETGIDDSGRKKGSLVSAFVQKYYQETGRQVIAVSASEGGTTSAQWKDNLVKDGADRLQITRKFLKTQGITPEHIYMIWCQGESDGDNNIDGEQYKRNMEEIWNIMKCMSLLERKRQCRRRLFINKKMQNRKLFAGFLFCIFDFRKILKCFPILAKGISRYFFELGSQMAL